MDERLLVQGTKVRGGETGRVLSRGNQGANRTIEDGGDGDDGDGQQEKDREKYQMQERTVVTGSPAEGKAEQVGVLGGAKNGGKKKTVAWFFFHTSLSHTVARSRSVALSFTAATLSYGRVWGAGFPAGLLTPYFVTLV